MGRVSPFLFEIMTQGFGYPYPPHWGYPGASPGYPQYPATPATPAAPATPGVYPGGYPGASGAYLHYPATPGGYPSATPSAPGAYPGYPQNPAVNPDAGGYPVPIPGSYSGYHTSYPPTSSGKVKKNKDAKAKKTKEGKKAGKASQPVPSGSFPLPSAAFPPTGSGAFPPISSSDTLSSSASPVVLPEPAVLSFQELPSVDVRLFDYYLQYPDGWKGRMGEKRNGSFGHSNDMVYLPKDPEELAALVPFDMLLGATGGLELWNWDPAKQHKAAEAPRLHLLPPKDNPKWKPDCQNLQHISAFSVSGKHVLGLGGSELQTTGTFRNFLQHVSCLHFILILYFSFVKKR